MKVGTHSCPEYACTGVGTNPSSVSLFHTHPLREPLTGTGPILGTGDSQAPYYVAGKQDTEQLWEDSGYRVELPGPVTWGAIFGSLSRAQAYLWDMEPRTGREGSLEELSGI